MSAPLHPRDHRHVAPRSIIGRSLAFLFLLALVGVGLEGIRRLNLQFYLRDEPGGLLNSLAADQTTDSYFRELLVAQGVAANQIHRPTRALRKALATLPTKGSIVVVFPRSINDYGVMGETIRYLSLPRFAYFLPCDHPERAMIPADENVVAVLLYLIDPPTGTSGYVQVMPRLTMIEMKEGGQWKSYCSR